MAVVLGAAAGLWVSVSSLPVAAQAGAPVTVETLAGETIDGRMVSASASEIVIAIAGQQITLRVGELRYVSFVGRLEEGTGDGGPDPRVMDAVFGLRSLEAAAEVDYEDEERERYERFFRRISAPIEAFLEAFDPEWQDVKSAARRALAKYRAPASADYQWSSRSTSFRDAVPYLDYAAQLAADPAERDHLEVGDEVFEIQVGEAMRGRLGWGDRLMSRGLDRSSEDAYNDLFRFTLDVPTRIDIELTCWPCRPHLTLTDENGEKIEGDAGGGLFGGGSRIRRDLAPGAYYIWAGATDEDDVGEYTLEVRPRV